MQAAFYGVSGVLPKEEALELLKNSISEQYARKGPDVVGKNHKAVDVTLENLQRVEYPSSWLTATTGGRRPGNEIFERPEFVKSVMDPVLALEGDKLPVRESRHIFDELRSRLFRHRMFCALCSAVELFRKEI